MAETYIPPWRLKREQDKLSGRNIGPVLAPTAVSIVQKCHPLAMTASLEDLAGSMRQTTLFKRERFVMEYLKDFSIKKAALRIGCAAHSAAQQGHAILNEPYVQRRILQVLEDMEEADLLTRKDVILGLLTEARTAESDAARVAAWAKLSKIKGMEIDMVSGLFEHRHHVMEVPVERGVVDWEEAAVVAQDHLKEEVRK
jgi:phage terminase small subunit